MTSKRQIRRELERVGWEVHWENAIDRDDETAVGGGYGPYRLAVGFDRNSGEPLGVVSQRLGDDTVSAEKWAGLESLPAPQRIVRRLSRRRRSF
jgi:hypothetical protein